MSALDGTLFVLQAMGIGPSGVVGVFSSLEHAGKAAEKILPQTDGYHGLEVRPFTLDVAEPYRFPYGDGSHLGSSGDALRVYVKEASPS